MNSYKYLYSYILVFTLIFCLTGCSINSKTSTEKKEHRPQYNIEENSEVFVDNDGVFDYKLKSWKGPENYRIVIPQDDANAKESALILQAYYKSVCNIEPEIVTDDNGVSEKEILVGNTNRDESKNSLKESELEVFVKGKKLVFSGGHYVTLDSAVKKFTRLQYKAGKANVFKLETDFVSSALDGYQYVWGDEFEGNDIDYTKWNFVQKMEGSEKIEVSYDSDVISVSDGRLKLHALHYFNPERKGTEFKVPYSVATQNNMNFVHGYVEIRARVPYFKGAWPSFWTQTTDVLSGKVNPKYMLEVDVFEVFGSENKVIPNLHKWYKGDYDYGNIYFGESNKHTLWGDLEENKDIWVWENSKDISNEYHIYGFEWTEKEMSMYIDGEEYMTFDITKSFDLDNDLSGFSDPQFLMFNNHVFTDDSISIGSLIDDALDKLPSCFYIDWCRLYQKNGDGKLYLSNTANEYPNRK